MNKQLLIFATVILSACNANRTGDGNHDGQGIVNGSFETGMQAIRNPAWQWTTFHLELIKANRIKFYI